MVTTNKKVSTAATVAALGVVFGDIGTSPLYALSLLFSPGSSHAMDVNNDNVLGILSTIFWLVTAVVTVKYGSLILRADNKGEGGVMALYTLLKNKVGTKKLPVLTIMVFAGAALFLGDAIITPAISVLAAVEGIGVLAPGLHTFIIPIVVGILITLFAVQRFGTAKISRMFGPVMCVWFTVLAGTGIVQIVKHPSVLAAASPHYAFNFITQHPILFLGALSIVLLSVTGVEALYADLGHFGRKPIFAAWIWIAFPALMLNYFGQGALLLNAGVAPENLFYSLVPPVALPLLIILATCATIIAAQAVISGAFSLTAQASQLGLLPRLRLRFPSGTTGQVYVAAVNWSLFLIVGVIVIAFGSSEKLASAYGISVVACMFTDTILFFWLTRLRTKRPAVFIYAVAAVFIAVDVTLFISCLPKLVTGGWMPVTIAVLVFSAFHIWAVGARYVKTQRKNKEGSLSTFISHVNTDQVTRIPTTAVYLHPDAETVPLAMRTAEERFGVLHAHAVIVSVITADVPNIVPAKRTIFDDLKYDDGIWHLRITYGFDDAPNIPETLAEAVRENPELMSENDLEHATFYVSRFDVGTATIPGLPGMFARIFKWMKSWAADPIKYFHLPLSRTVTISAHVD